MRRFFATVALTLLTATSAAAAEPKPETPVLLNSKVVVEGPILYLGDLFEGLDDALEHRPAPLI